MIRNSSLFLSAAIVAAISALFSPAAHATNQPKPPAPTPVQQQQQQQATLNASGGAGGASWLSSDSGNFYVLPAPSSAAALPPGICTTGESSSWSIGWNFFSTAHSSVHTDMQCLEVLVAYRNAPPAPQLAPMTDAERATLERLDRESQQRAQAKACPVPSPKPPAAAKRRVLCK